MDYNGQIKKLDEKMRTFRVDVYLVKIWMEAINLALGAVTVAFMAVGLFCEKGEALFTVGTIGTVAGAAALIGYNIFLRLRGPMNFTEYVIRDGGREYVFQLFSRRWSAFYDGERGVAADRRTMKPLDGHLCGYCRYNSYLDCDFSRSHTEGGVTVYEGKGEYGGRRQKHKLTVRDGFIQSENVGGVRKRFFDINDDESLFAVPEMLEAVAAQAGMRFPDSKKIVIQRLKK